MKRCSKCKVEKPLSEFNKKCSAKDGYRSECKICSNIHSKNYYGEHKKEILEGKRKYHRDCRRGLRIKTKRVIQDDKEYQDGRVDRYRAWYKKYCKKHRDTIRGHLKSCFNNIKHRCDNPESEDYKNYGGRGIRNKFRSANDLIDYVVDVLKIDPRKLQIDRIDNNGHYEKGNIRFVTSKVNNNNKRKK